MIYKRRSHRGVWILFAIGLALLIGCGGITMKTLPSAELQYKEALKEYQKEHYLKAIDGFQKVIYNFSGASMVDSAQYFLAMAYYGQEDFYLAAAEFDRLVNSYPGSPFVDDAQYMAGLCYYKASPENYGLDQEELARAIRALEDFVIDHPESELAADARLALTEIDMRLARKKYESGRLYFRLGYYESAAVYFQAVIDNHTDTEWAARALYYLGEIEYKQKQYQDAKTRFDNFLVVYPDHDYAKKARKKLENIEDKLAKATDDK